MVEDATGRKTFDLASGKRKPEVEPQNVMGTIILFREKEDDKKEKQRRLQTPLGHSGPCVGLR